MVLDKLTFVQIVAAQDGEVMAALGVDGVIYVKCRDADRRKYPVVNVDYWEPLNLPVGKPAFLTD